MVVCFSQCMPFSLAGDIEPGAAHLLLPFLTTQDCLRLSECSKGLLPYRHHLPHLQIKRQKTTRPGLFRILKKQDDLKTLAIEDPRVLRAFHHTKWMCCRKVNHLRIFFPHTPGQARAVRQGLRGGYLRSVEHVELESSCITHQYYVSPHIVRQVLKSLDPASVPNLRSLHFSYSYVFSSISDYLAEALQKGPYPHLREISLSGTYLARYVMPCPIITAIKKGMCPNLKKLVLTDCFLTTLNCEDLEGVLGPLEAFVFKNNIYVTSFGMVSILNGLGSATGLRELDIASTCMTLENSVVLGIQMASSWPNLEVLKLHKAFCAFSGSFPVLDALGKAECCPHLRELDVSSTQLCVEHARKLRDILAQRPQLRALNISYNPDLGREGVETVLGACGNVEELEINCVGEVGGLVVPPRIKRFSRLEIQCPSVEEDLAILDLLPTFSSSREICWVDIAVGEQTDSYTLAEKLCACRWENLQGIGLSKIKKNLVWGVHAYGRDYYTKKGTQEPDWKRVRRPCGGGVCQLLIIVPSYKTGIYAVAEAIRKKAFPNLSFFGLDMSTASKEDVKMRDHVRTLF